jgi:hypothetical protein
MPTAATATSDKKARSVAASRVRRATGPQPLLGDEVTIGGGRESSAALSVKRM